MYINQILQYLLWPALILISWFAIRVVLSCFEKKEGVSKAKEQTPAP